MSISIIAKNYNNIALLEGITMPINEIHIMKQHGLPFIFRPYTRSKQKSHGTYLNWHRNIEILYCIEGKAFLYIDNKQYCFSEGDCFIINTNQMHHIEKIPGEYLVHHCLIIDRDFCFANDIDTDKCRFITKVRDKIISDAFDDLLSYYTVEKNLAIAKIRKTVLELMIYLCSAYIDKTIDTSSFTVSGIERTNAVLNFIRENYTQRITLDEMASAIGISKYYLCREFKKINGVSVVEYINKLRCNKAKELLESGNTVSEASEKCGFESLPYFSETFKRYVGEMPSDIKKKKF